MLADVERLKAQTISHKVEAVYAALQAGGTATERPQIAPAGDEILKSAGWVDQTPDPSIAQLGAPPVQPEENQAPAGAGGASVAMNNGAPAMPHDTQAPTGMAGRRAGIETAAIE